MKKLNGMLGYSHIALGVLLVVVGLVHGLASSQSVLSANVGTFLWVLSILLGINYAVRRYLPKKSTWIVIHRYLTILLLACLVWHIVDVGGIGVFRAADKLNNKQPLQPQPVVSGSVSPEVADNSAQVSSTVQATSSLIEKANESAMGAVFKDGTYTGVADGFGPNLTVSVTIQDNKITDIEIVSHNERNQRYFARPMREVPAAIIEGQTLDVDTVAGATYTSVGIINAVRDALSQALVSGEIK